jgi:hypothetical protein
MSDYLPPGSSIDNPSGDRRFNYAGVSGVAGAEAPVDEEVLGGALTDAFMGSSEQQDPEQARKKKKLKLGPGAGYGWQVGSSDINPNGFTPVSAHSQQIGRYGGSPLFAATFAAPAGAFAAREQGLVEKQAGIDDAWKKLKPEIANVENPKYKESFDKWAVGSINDHIAAVKEEYGEEEAYAQLTTPGTAEYERLKLLERDTARVGQSIDAATKNALEITVGMDNGTLQQNEVLYKKAEDVINKAGKQTGLTPKEAADSFERLNASVSLMDQLKKDGVQDLLKEAGSGADLVTLLPPDHPLYHKKFVSDLNESTVDRTAAIDAITDEYYKQYKNDMSREDLREMVESITPTTFEQKVSRKAIPQPKSSGGGGAKTQSSHDVEEIVVPREAVDAFGKPVNKHAGPDGKEIYRSSMVLKKFTSGQGQLSQPDVFKAGSERIDMMPTDLVNVDNELYIVGKRAGLPRTTMIKERDSLNLTKKEKKSLTADQQARLSALTKVLAGTGDEKDNETIQSFYGLQDVMIPAKGNWNTLKESFGIEEEDARKRLGVGAPAQSKGADNDPGGLRNLLE